MSAADTQTTPIQYEAFLALEALLNFPGGMYAPALEKNARAALAKVTALINSHAELVDVIASLDARLRECGALHTAEDAYDSFYQSIVAEALAKARGEQP